MDSDRPRAAARAMLGFPFTGYIDNKGRGEKPAFPASRCLAPHDWRSVCGIAQKVYRFRSEDSVGGTPTEAVETTALPGGARRTGVFEGAIK